MIVRSAGLGLLGLSKTSFLEINMKLFKLTAMALAIAASSQANAWTIGWNGNWGFNYQGTGLAGAYQPIDEMTYQGISYVETDPTVAGSPTAVNAGDTFHDVGRLGATGFQNDGSPLLSFDTGLGSTYMLTAVFTDWTGTFGATLGNHIDYAFNVGGTLDIYLGTGGTIGYNSFATATDGVKIMTLTILDGEGTIDFNNPGGVDGNINILFGITDVKQGYWFLDTDGDGTPDTDIYDMLGLGQLTVGLTDSNANIFTPTTAVATDFIATTGLGHPNSAGDIYVLNDGSMELATTIPEPGTLALLGLGLAGLGLSVRRKAA